MTKKWWIVAGAGFVLVVFAGIWWARQAAAPAVVPETGLTNNTPAVVSADNNVATTQGVVSASRPFPINPVDQITSWNFKGIYSGNAILTKQAQDDITLLTGLLGKGKYDDYDLYNGRANDYSTLGNGTSAYQDFNRAIAIHPTKGLAFINLAQVMDKLGAHETAADAYTKAVAVEPGTLEYHVARLTYLTRQFASDTARISAAFSDASKQFGDAAPVLAIEAEWLTGQKRYADAIKAWETMQSLSMGKDTSAIAAEIARLQAKQ